MLRSERCEVSARQVGGPLTGRTGAVSRMRQKHVRAALITALATLTVWGAAASVAGEPSGGPARVTVGFWERSPLFEELAAGTDDDENNVGDGPTAEADEPPTVELALPAFLLPAMPQRYDDWGIRDRWRGPVQIELSADVALPPGKHRLLVRSRRRCRVWVADDLVVDTGPARLRKGNLEPILPIAEPPFPGGRRKPFAHLEQTATVTIAESPDADQPIPVRLQTIVGGGNWRIEAGELTAAVQLDGDGPFLLLTPGRLDQPLTETGVRMATSAARTAIRRSDDIRRRAAAASMADFWTHRHELAAAADHLPAADKMPLGIDRHIASKIAAAHRASDDGSEQTERFYGEVLPILQDECFRCHGPKASGGLRLDSLAAALSAGESEMPAIIPGDPDGSELIYQVTDRIMPPTESGLTDDQIATLRDWVADGAFWPDRPVPSDVLRRTDPVGDAAFVRRAYLDSIGLPPTESQFRDFIADESPDKRAKLVQGLLADERMADHWVTFWTDLLAENPTLLNASLGSTGPFRWFLHESLRDNKPVDRMVTELIVLRGDSAAGGSAGFAVSGESDAPMADKAHIIATAFLGMETGCARCHDAPFHSTTQEDLFALAAMLRRKPITPPETSRVPVAFFETASGDGHASLIEVTLPPDQAVEPAWPFSEQTGAGDGDHVIAWLPGPDDPRQRLAAIITGPDNARFPRVVTNYVWRRLIGEGLVEPPSDWEGQQPSHPELLDELAAGFVRSGYNLRALIATIMSSELYAAESSARPIQPDPRLRFFAAPHRRRLQAEQIVDSLFAATGRQMAAEELTFVHDASLPRKKRLSLGTPRRAWEFASLNNERDRPSLAKPAAQSIVDVLAAFGWVGAKQKPLVSRVTDPNILQPGILSNGTLTQDLATAARGGGLAELAVEAADVESLIDSLFVRILGRSPTRRETESIAAVLRPRFADRIVSPELIEASPVADPLPVVTWTNHLVSEANTIQQQRQEQVEAGPSPDPRLDPDWRVVYEDLVWSLLNEREFVWMP